MKKIMIFGAVGVLLILSWHGIMKGLFAKNPWVKWDYEIARESHFLRRDTYNISIYIYHEAEEPLSGNVMFVVHGPCKLHLFEPEVMKQIEELGNDTYAIRVTDWQPGKNNLKMLCFDLNSPELNEKGLSEEEVKKRISLKITGGFYPKSDSMYQESISSKLVGKP